MTPLFWFQKGHVILGLDSGYSMDHITFFQNRVHAWMPNPNFGVDMSIEMGLLPLVALPALISYLGVSIFDVQKVLLVGWFFVIAVSIYLFFRELFPKRDQWIARLVGVFIYLFNFHLYSFWLQGEQPMLASYVILPLFTLLLYRFAIGKTKLLKTAVLMNITYLFFNSGGIRGVPLIGPVILTGGSIFVYFLIINWRQEKFSYILRFLYLAILFILIMLPLNAYWIFPFIASFSHEFNTQVTIAGGIEGAVSWAEFVSGHDSFLNLFRLQGDNNWYFFPFLWSNNYLVNPLLILSSFVFPILAFAAPLFSKEKSQRRIILFFSLLALISLFFAAGAHPPFGEIYSFMMKYIPGFATFRSAYYKFMPTVYFSFAVLIGFTAYSLLNKVKSNMRVTLGVLFLAFILIYNYPFFQNTNADFNKPFTTQVKIPNYVTDFEKMINNSNIQEKILVVPQTNARITIKEYTWGYYGAFSLFALFTDKSFVQYDAYLFNDSANALIGTMYEKLRKGDYTGFNNAVSVSGIKYVLLTKDVAYNYSIIPLENPSVYENILSDERYFKKIWSRGKWIMYEIKYANVQPLISTVDSISVINPDTSALNNYFEESGGAFVLPDQIRPSLLKKIKRKSELTGYPCISCTLNTPQELPVIADFNVRPDSFLYLFKLKRDASLLSEASNQNQKLDIALGLSLKRASELNSVLTHPINLNVENQWTMASDVILEYWTVIDNFMRNNLSYPDYNTYSKIHGYASVEKDVLVKITASPDIQKNPEFENSVFRVISKIEKIDSQLQVILTEKDWKKNFLYTVDKNTKIQDLIIQPESKVTLEADSPAFAKVAKLPYYHSGKDIALINVELPDMPNQLTNKKTVQLAFPGNEKPCFSYAVESFRWDKKYLLTVTSLNESTPKTVYVKMTRGHFQTQDTIAPDVNFFTPDFTFNPSNKENSVSTFEFSGQQNDESASVYVCTNSSFDPNLALRDLALQEEIIPDVYAFSNLEQKQSVPPFIRYKKINATKYIINVVNAKSSFIFSFLQTSSPNWKLYSNGQEQKDKFMINGFANGWYIQKTGTYSLTLEFYTEQAFHKGIFVTLLSLSTIGIYLLWTFKKNEN